MAAQRAGQHGFTFFELMIVLVLLGIALAMGVPRLQDSVQRSRVVSTAGDFLVALTYARNQAISSGRDVVICTSSNKTACTTTGGWEDGWIVYRDVNADGALTTPGDEILRKHNGLGNITVTPTTATTSIMFTPRGYSTENDFRFCGPGTDGSTHGRTILLENTGRALRSRTTGGCP